MSDLFNAFFLTCLSIVFFKELLQDNFQAKLLTPSNKNTGFVTAFFIEFCFIIPKKS